MIVPVLMAGGSGSRLWPLSREQYPKQFLRLLGEHSLLQGTALRAARVVDSAPALVIGGDAHRFVIAEQLRQIGLEGAAVMLEPEGRNTAPAAAVAAHYASTHYGPQALVFLMAADQAMVDEDAFVAAVAAATPIAESGRIVTFGIQPTHPETGFGYIKAGPPIGIGGGKAGSPTDGGAYEVSAFVEKPAMEKARAFIAEGGYYWNGGMFLFRADVFLDELKKLEPEMHAASLQSWNNAVKDLDFLRLEPAAFRRCRSESIDYAVMERTTNIALVPLDAGWDDVGSWTYLGKQAADDAAGNRLRGDVMLEDSRDNLVHADARLVALVGVTDTVVIETQDAVLVAARDRVQDVKKIVQRLKREKRTEADSNPRVYRPWGSYETVAEGERFQVKRIVVKPGQKLSLQMHHHRAEHWIVVKGTARVHCGDKDFLLGEDQSTYIPLGQKHRLENPGKVPLELIEVQSGTYLGEDDIVRFDDVYGRTPAVIADKLKS